MSGEEEVDSLWPTPGGWRWSLLGDVATIRIGKTPARAEAKYWNDGVFPWVSIADLTNGLVVETKELVSETALSTVLARKVAPAGTLLLSFKLTIGKVGILDMDAAHNEAIAAVIPEAEDLSRDYLFYLFQSFPFKKYRDPYVKGPTLNKTKLLRLPVPIPPVDEQLRIVSVLDAVRTNREAQLRLTEALDTALSALGYSLVRGWRSGGELP